MLPVYGRAGIVAHAAIDQEDLRLVDGRRWHMDRDGAVWCHDFKNRTTAKLHRIITGAQKGMDVDHINHNRLDNRRCNLRVCTHADNMMNHAGYKGSQRGIIKAKNRWQARIMARRVNHYLGSFKTPEEAIAAHRAAERRLRGEFAPVVVA